MSHYLQLREHILLVGDIDLLATSLVPADDLAETHLVRQDSIDRIIEVRVIQAGHVGGAGYVHIRETLVNDVIFVAVLINLLASLDLNVRQ